MTSEQIKQAALKLGFSACGISAAGYLASDANYLEKWLKKGNNANMGYMLNYLEKRTDPRLLFDGAKSVISLAYNYYTTVKQTAGAPIISKYAYGTDYHFILKDKLNKLALQLSNSNNAACRVFTDSAPVLERAWAARSGIGWVGKNTNIITRKGSFVFLGEIITNAVLTYDVPDKNRCGTCNRCVEACPTGALNKPYELDSRKCISYLTIEHKGEMPQIDLNNRIFGCDICQDVCPWNRFAEQNNDPYFLPNSEIMNKTLYEWQNLQKTDFNRLFKKSPVKRAGYNKLMLNASLNKIL